MIHLLELPAVYVDEVVADVRQTRPVVINRDPEPGESGVPQDSLIRLQIVDILSDGIERSATRVTIDGLLAFNGGSAVEFPVGFDGPLSAVTETADTLEVSIDTAASFASLVFVDVRVVSQTKTTAIPTDLTYRFQIEDLTAPLVVSAQAIAAKRVRVLFDEPMRQLGDGLSIDALTTANYAFAPVTVPAVAVMPVGAVASSATSIDVELDIALSQGKAYELVATSAVDTAGNPIGETGNRATFSGFIPPKRPAKRDFDLFELLPSINRQEDLTGDLKNFMEVLQDVVELLLAHIDCFTEILDPDLAPPGFLDLMLLDLGNPFRFDLTELQKRRLIGTLVQIYKQKGTAVGIQSAIRFFLGVDVTSIDAFHGTRLVLGEAELGVDWELGPSDRFALYAFDITVNRALTEEERTQIRQIVTFMKPERTHFVDLIEPGAAAFVDHWELGLSLLGETSDLH